MVDLCRLMDLRRMSYSDRVEIERSVDSSGHVDLLFVEESPDRPSACERRRPGTGLKIESPAGSVCVVAVRIGVGRGGRDVEGWLEPSPLPISAAPEEHERAVGPIPRSATSRCLTETTSRATPRRRLAQPTERGGAPSIWARLSQLGS